ncbi:hypothetical protein DFJ77DRAFT_462764 [Powellomyces hirtus]|nr:hypothetical protein DFJ77DRAFT_462764 [Powellomyces hirtus]
MGSRRTGRDEGGGGNSDLRSGRSSQHTFVTFGTEQPEDPLDVKAKERNKYLPVHMQEPRDEQGRKRFHGAFTGGFSAGYFNSVGSKEGWAPSQFVSSRSSRYNPASAAKPEDFMDEEDLEAIGDGQKIAATEDYDIVGGTAKELARKRAAVSAAGGDSQNALGAVAGKLVEDLIGPAKDPIGIKLLRQMGWREGHGVGPRAKRKAKNGVEDIHAANHTFAPRDISIDLLKPKTDSFGLGYNPFHHAPEFAGRGSQSQTTGKNEPQSAAKPGKGGFGVGVFEDEDEDLDVYGSGMASYDMIIDDDEDRPMLKRKFDGGASRQQSTLRTKDRHITGFDLTISICHDGRPPLEGFTLAKTAMPEPKWYAPPELPAAFVPMHDFAAAPLPAGSTPSHVDSRIHPSRQAQQHEQSQLTADMRRDILGEEALKAPQRSVFSFLPIKEQDRLQEFIDKAARTRGNSAVAGSNEDKTAPKDAGPKVDKDTALAALKGFMPFGNDMPKQQRYRRFLEVKAGLAAEYAANPKHLTRQDIAHEKLEFSKAAQIFKPLSSMMASRFTSASQPTDTNYNAPSAKTDVQNGAAQMNMYGALTRTRTEWRPEKLLCKRFNVADPYAKQKKKGGGEDDEDAREQSRIDEEKRYEKEALNKRAMNDLFHERDRLVAQGILKAAPDSVADEITDGGAKETLTRDAVSVQLKNTTTTSIKQEEEPDDGLPDEVPERPAMDIFKAIFADSDEDESDSDEEDVNTTPLPLPQSQRPAAEPHVPPLVQSKASPLSSPSLPPPAREKLPPPIFRPVFRKKEDRGKAVKPPAEVAAATPPGSSVVAPSSSLQGALDIDGAALDNEPNPPRQESLPIPAVATPSQSKQSVFVDSNEPSVPPLPLLPSRSESTKKRTRDSDDETLPLPLPPTTASPLPSSSRKDDKDRKKRKKHKKDARDITSDDDERRVKRKRDVAERTDKEKVKERDRKRRRHTSSSKNKRRVYSDEEEEEVWLEKPVVKLPQHHVQQDAVPPPKALSRSSRHMDADGDRSPRPPSLLAFESPYTASDRRAETFGAPSPPAPTTREKPLPPPSSTRHILDESDENESSSTRTRARPSAADFM